MMSACFTALIITSSTLGGWVTISVCVFVCVRAHTEHIRFLSGYLSDLLGNPSSLSDILAAEDFAFAVLKDIGLFERWKSPF